MLAAEITSSMYADVPSFDCTCFAGGVIYIYKFNGYRTRLAIMEDNGKKVVLLQRIWHKNESRCNCVCVCCLCV